VETISAWLDVYGEATIPIVLLVALSAAMAGKVVVAERARQRLKATLRELLGRGMTLIGADTALLLFFDRESQGLFADIALGLDSDFFTKNTVPRGTSVSGRVLETGEPVLVDDLYTDERFQTHPRRDELHRRGFAAVISVPLGLGDRIIGVMSLSSTKPGQFGETHLRLLEPIAGEIALAIGNARIFEVTRTNWED